MQNSFSFDAIVIGASAIGLNTALAIKRKNPHSRVALVERFDRPGLFASGHNAGLIHSGIHESRRFRLKAETCIEGNALLQQYCEAQGVQLKKTGMLIAVSKALSKEAQYSASKRMHALLANADEMSVRYELVEGAQVIALSGNRLIREAIHVPDVFLLNIQQYLSSLQRLAADQQIQGFYGARITTVEAGASEWIIGLSDGQTLRAAQVVNCTGGHADQVASLFGVEIPAHILYQGDFWAIRDEGLAEQVRVPINPVMPEGQGKGVHVFTTLNGEVWIGPITKTVSDRDYGKLIDAKRLPVSEEELAACASLFFDAPPSRFAFRDTGFRSKVVAEGVDDDFHFEVFRPGGLYFSTFYGIQSPGLTASIALGRLAAAQLG